MQECVCACEWDLSSAAFQRSAQKTWQASTQLSATRLSLQPLSCKEACTRQEESVNTVNFTVWGRHLIYSLLLMCSLQSHQDTSPESGEDLKCFGRFTCWQVWTQPVSRSSKCKMQPGRMHATLRMQANLPSIRDHVHYRSVSTEDTKKGLITFAKLCSVSKSAVPKFFSCRGPLIRQRITPLTPIEKTL